jgi:hypothetical protein
MLDTRVLQFVERLRKEVIGVPQMQANGAYEYKEHSPKVVAVLKLVRAAQGVSAIALVVRSGFFVDFGALMRCANDSIEEIYFLLENYPGTNPNVDQFVANFFEKTIDDHLTGTTPQVQTNKIRAAVVRVLKDGKQDYKTQQRLEKIFKTFSGYVHANYAHIMEVYNGHADDFNLRGVPSVRQRQMREAFVEIEADAVLSASAFIARTLGLEALYQEIKAFADEEESPEAMC